MFSPIGVARLSRFLSRDRSSPTSRPGVAGSVPSLSSYDQFVVDVGFADSISWTPDAIETSDLLSFAGIERVRVPALPLPQHVAEKVHAYTRKYGANGRESTRPKDLVDILLIAGSERLDAGPLRKALEATFEQREQQPLPSRLPAPPASWREPYR